mgnify:CR=1 FL=1
MRAYNAYPNAGDPGRGAGHISDTGEQRQLNGALDALLSDDPGAADQRAATTGPSRSGAWGGSGRGDPGREPLAVDPGIR